MCVLLEPLFDRSRPSEAHKQHETAVVHAVRSDQSGNVLQDVDDWRHLHICEVQQARELALGIGPRHLIRCDQPPTLASAERCAWTGKAGAGNISATTKPRPPSKPLLPHSADLAS